MGALERDRCADCGTAGVTAPPPEATLRECDPCGELVCEGCDQGDVDEDGRTWWALCKACAGGPCPQTERREDFGADL